MVGLRWVLGGGFRWWVLGGGFRWWVLGGF